MDNQLTYLGICMGASTISIVRLGMDPDGSGAGSGQPLAPHIIDHGLYTHEGNPRKALLKALDELNVGQLDRVAATGRKFRSFLNLTTISEPEAVEEAYSFVKPQEVDCTAVVSAGGETFMVYVLDGTGRIAHVLTGNKCASGTGEFFLQQLRRMNVSLSEAALWAADPEPYVVSGRCSVFCKSDCTHATNKGVPKSKVTAGLCRMMAAKIIELLKKVPHRDIMITGGMTRNQMMIQYLRDQIHNLIVPEAATYFEALGAALWSMKHPTASFPGKDRLFTTRYSSFDTLAPLVDFADQVEFKTIETGTIRSGDVCILGLDVGSTTTKAVLTRRQDAAMLASVYLRTNGDPVAASRRCYREIERQIALCIDPTRISIVGLGVCGSGRQIAGLHAFTEGVINEIVAHAAATVHFDPKVDTIFEIGGQDAKYTYITNGVPSDYAMNEACSAGTGSFLEESAHEALGLAMEDIADAALEGRCPPNFNDQCAAFIASDIKTAIHENVSREDIVAGLVYSICMNYTNRVKGNRPVGEKVFMQGGVCYNRAVPLAMAALVGKPVVVPPEPGLMGAFGAALVIRDRLDSGQMLPQRFDLQTLADREVGYGKSFVCRGGAHRCDLRCNIARIQIDGKLFPFGGACNRYVNLRRRIVCDTEKLDMVRLRQRLVFETFAPPLLDRDSSASRGRVGINRSFLVNTYYPLYAHFFRRLGFAPVLPDRVLRDGIDQKNAAFCYPVEQAHGFFAALIAQKPQFIFLPHFKSIPGLNGHQSAQLCPLVQGEPFYLQTTFKEALASLAASGTRVIRTKLDLRNGLEHARESMVEAGKQLGVSRREARSAFAAALERQRSCLAEMKRLGRQALAEIEADPQKIAVVIFARPYNGFAQEAHMGIPRKFASRGIAVIPMDFLPLEHRENKRHMYWGMGQQVLSAAAMVKDHPQLFGVYITNFSCGPDSFLLGYFRTIMGQKPSLTLELDSHTADAGLETRIEAFLDIVAASSSRSVTSFRPAGSFVPAAAMFDGELPRVRTSSGHTLPMTDDRVTVLFPSMGQITSEAMAAVFRGAGFRAKAHRPSDEAILKLGRANTTCKECLPLILTTGILLDYVRHEKRDGEVLVYFMPTGGGPCRFGQYHVFMQDLVKRLELPDVAMFSPSSDDAYAGLENGLHKKGWQATVIADVLEDIRAMILANAADPGSAVQGFNRQLQGIFKALENGTGNQLETTLAQATAYFQTIALKRPVTEVPRVLLTGEIFVRRDALSRRHLTEQLAELGFAAVCSPVAEWIHYTDYLLENGMGSPPLTLSGKIGHLFKRRFMIGEEKRLKSILSASGLVDAAPVRIQSIIEQGAAFISPELEGEAILTVGCAMEEVASHVCGVIAIGPFGCMPNRLSEAILSDTMNASVKMANGPGPKLRATLSDVDQLPFLAIESDGSPFPQVIHAKLEAFCLRANRMHEKMRTVHLN